MNTPRPPRIARWLLERALPADVREHVTGDLQELYVRRHAAGATRARLWYMSQVLSLIRQFLGEHFRERAMVSNMSTGLSWLDVKLGVRMLARYPGLALVGVFGMAVGIAIASGAFTIIFGLLRATVPLDEGDRVVAIVTWNTATNNRETGARRISRHGARAWHRCRNWAPSAP